MGTGPSIPLGTAIVLDDHGHVPLDQPLDSGCWGLPGGALEPGESVEDAARRELPEKSGLLLSVNVRNDAQS